MPQIPEEMFDVRKLERFLQEGALTPEQVTEHLAGLEDCADNADTSHIQMTRSTRRRASYGEEPGAEEDEG